MKITRRAIANRKWLIHAVVLLCIMIVVGLFCYFYLIVPQNPFLWDEASHNLYGFKLAQSLEQGDFAQLLQSIELRLLGHWPAFGYSLVAGVAFAILGDSINVARLVSTAALAFSIPLIFVIAFKLLSRERGGTAAGYVALALSLSSPMILYQSSFGQQEALGLLFTLLALLVFFYAIETARARYYTLTGIVTALVFFERTPFGILLLATLALMGLSELLIERTWIRICVNYSWLGFGFAVLVVPIYWFPSGLLQAKIHALVAQGGGTQAEDWYGLPWVDSQLFYLRALASTYVASLWIFLLVLAALARSFVDYRQRKVRFLMLFVLVNAVIVPLIIKTKQDRYVYCGVAVLFLLSSCHVVTFYKALPSRARWSVIALALLILPDLFYLPLLSRQVGNFSNDACVYQDEYVESARFSPPFLGGLVSRPVFLLPRHGFLNENVRVPPGGFKNDIYSVLGYIKRNTDVSQHVNILTFFPEMSPDLIEWFFRDTPGQVFSMSPTPQYDSKYWVTLQVDRTSPYYTWQYGRVSSSFPPLHRVVQEKLDKGYLTPYRSIQMSDIGIDIHIYQISEQDPDLRILGRGWQNEFGAWSQIAQGKLVIPPGGNVINRAIAGTDIDFAADVNPTGSAGLFVFFGYRDRANCGVFELSQKNHTMSIFRLVNSQYVGLKNVQTYLPSEKFGTLNSLRLVVHDKTITGYINGAAAISTEDDAAASGYVGLSTIGDSPIEFRNVDLRVIR